MSRSEKMLKKFLVSPARLPYRDIALVLTHLGFVEVPAKGSHVKWKHYALANDLIIPVHNHECKSFYKDLARSCVQKLINTSL